MALLENRGPGLDGRCICVLLGFLFLSSTAAATATDTVLEFEPGSSWEPFHTCTAADSMPQAWYSRGTNTTYFMGASHARMVAGIGATLDEAPTACSGQIFNGTHDRHGYESGPQTYANFQWLQSVRVFADGTAAGLVHNEFKGEFSPWNDGRYCSKHCTDAGRDVNASSGCKNVICEIWSTGLAVSTNGGSSFELVATPPQHLVAALPHRYNFDSPISGYGAISSIMRGVDGAFYGSINCRNNCVNGSTKCGNIPAGNCIWRSSNLKDPATFRAQDIDGNFTVKWGSAYVPGGEEIGACATINVTEDGPFGNHVTFRKIVGSGTSSRTGQPTFIAIGDVGPNSGGQHSAGRVKYSLSYETNFGEAMRNVNTSWTRAKFLDLGSSMTYHYPSMIDVRSPQHGEMGGTVEAQEDGDSFALISYPEAANITAPNGTLSVRVSGAGSSACNGVYAQAAVPRGFHSVTHFFKLDASHAAYKNAGVWHIAALGIKVYYTSTHPSPAGSSGVPPSTGWTVGDGDVGTMPAPTSVAAIAARQPPGSLYLYLRAGGYMRRKVRLRDV